MPVLSYLSEHSEYLQWSAIFLHLCMMCVLSHHPGTTVFICHLSYYDWFVCRWSHSPYAHLCGAVHVGVTIVCWLHYLFKVGWPGAARSFSLCASIVHIYCAMSVHALCVSYVLNVRQLDHAFRHVHGDCHTNSYKALFPMYECVSSMLARFP